MLSLCEVSKWFGSGQVLRSITFTVSRGETVVICGPSGGGKSTLLRCINRLEGIDGGRILFDGVDVHARETDPRLIRRQIGFVFQHFNLFPHLTALENVEVGPTRVLGLPRTEARQGAVELLTRVGLREKLDAYPAQLSGGQQQRVAIARALAMHPKLILFDEPTSALDPEMIGGVLSVMQQLSDSGMTMIVVTHEMGFARQAADRIAFLDAGEIVEEAPPAAFFGNPRSERARQFLEQIL